MNVWNYGMSFFRVAYEESGNIEKGQIRNMAIAFRAARQADKDFANWIKKLA